MKANALPILYSFRRCPYAMRARMALVASETICEIREISLKDKPEEMVTASSKATVPLFVLPDGKVIDESLDIMLWALNNNDPRDWLTPEKGSLPDMLDLIAQTEDPFKIHLDHYKYSVRYEGADPLYHRAEGSKFLSTLNSRLDTAPHLFGDRPALADYAIFPFIRQFANTDRTWFDALNLTALHAWLDQNLNADLFQTIMVKRPNWQEGQPACRLI